jgi:hypothetical protein
MTRTNTDRFVLAALFVLALSCRFASAANPSMIDDSSASVQDHGDTIDAPALATPDKARVDDPKLMQHICYHDFTCPDHNGSSASFNDIPGVGLTEPVAKTTSLNNATMARNICISNGHHPNAIVFDRCMGSIALTRELELAYSSLIMVEHNCYTQRGEQMSEFSFGLRQDLVHLSESAWNALVARAAGHGGVAPGSARTRVEGFFYYFAYQTVRSINPTTKIHREYSVEGRGTTDTDAIQSVERATKNVIAQLSYLGESPTAYGPVHVVPVVHLGNRVSTELCVFQCKTTKGGWKVIATAYAITKPEACTAAEAAAEAVATALYGGAKKCREIRPHEQPRKNDDDD